MAGNENEDVGWKYGVRIGGSRQQIMCKYCSRSVSGGVTRLKQHLAHRKGQVSRCPSVPQAVRGEKKKKAMLDQCRAEVFGAVSYTHLTLPTKA